MTKLIENKIGFVSLAGLTVLIFAIMSLGLFFKPTSAVATPAQQPTQVVEQPVIEESEPRLTAEDRRQIQCLAENAYFEAGNQSRRGKIAVSNVVMNRVEDGRFPKTPCGVVYQRTRGTCQFSWVCEGRKRIRSQEQYAEARETAEEVYRGNVGDVTRGAKFYHADYVNPRWNLRRVIQIGDHIFYRG